MNKLEQQVKEFWEFLPNHYHIESKEELEKQAENWNPKNAMLVALHYIWKREPKVTELEKENKKLKLWHENCKCSDYIDENIKYRKENVEFEREVQKQIDFKLEFNIENDRLRKAMCIYAREELGNMNFESDQDVVDYFLEFTKEV